MPYVPSEKTDGKSQDRIILDKVVEEYSSNLADQIANNNQLVEIYSASFLKVGLLISNLVRTDGSVEGKFVKTILEVADVYGYSGAFLGELNYSITRVIQRVPQLLAEQGKCGLAKGKELRYWLYAMTVSALTSVSIKLAGIPNLGVSGVFEDIKDEYKVRVNKSYEIQQILKSGDCYDTPYFNKVVEVRNEEGTVVGHTYVEFTNDGENVKLDNMPFHLTVTSSKVLEKTQISKKKEDYL